MTGKGGKRQRGCRGTKGEGRGIFCHGNSCLNKLSVTVARDRDCGWKLDMLRSHTLAKQASVKDTTTLDPSIIRA
jgi:hypothetical protein